MQIMLESKAMTVNSGQMVEYTIRKKKIDPLDKTQTVEHSEKFYENKKNDSVNGKRLSTIPLNENESESSTNGRSNILNSSINNQKKVKTNPDKFDGKYNAPPAPDFKSKLHIENENSHLQQPFKKPPPELHKYNRPPTTHENDDFGTYSHRPSQKIYNHINHEAFVQNKINFLPHIKLRDSSFGNTFIPVLPSFLTDLK